MPQWKRKQENEHKVPLDRRPRERPSRIAVRTLVPARLSSLPQQPLSESGQGVSLLITGGCPGLLTTGGFPGLLSVHGSMSCLANPHPELFECTARKLHLQALVSGSHNCTLKDFYYSILKKKTKQK